MTVWRNRNAGDPDGCYDVSEELGTPAVLFASRPDWVRRPDTGEKLRVLGEERRGQCPSCQAGDINGRVLCLEGGIRVLECPACHEFVFYTLGGAR